MNCIPRSAVTVASIGLSAIFLLFIPTAAAAAAEPVATTKAGIEYTERLAAEQLRSKAQVERDERASQSPASRTIGGGALPGAVDRHSSGGGAAAWQLALSAALGAAVTGGLVVASRQINQHRHAIAV